MLHPNVLELAECAPRARYLNLPDPERADLDQTRTDGFAELAQEAIRFSYDAGTEFFQLWLDQLVVSSCARWSQGAQTLEDAQIAKIDFHLQAVGAADCRSILDVGCGWGALLGRATTRYGIAKAVGITLSDEQEKYITSQNRPGVTVLKGRYEQLETQVDGIVSIGAFEHFVRPGYSRERKLEIYRQFFARCHRWLGGRGRLSLETICWGKARQDQCTKLPALDVFPHSDLPYEGEILEAANGYFELQSTENGREDYIITLEHWLLRIQERRQVIVDQHGGTEKFQYYERSLRRAIAGFEHQEMTLLRLVFTAADRTTVAACRGEPSRVSKSLPPMTSNRHSRRRNHLATKFT
jgi:cyclopropane-fatty-acyl-phospholipid synthase